jgi:hypothetical protein
VFGVLARRAVAVEIDPDLRQWYSLAHAICDLWQPNGWTKAASRLIATNAASSRLHSVAPRAPHM